MNNVFDSIKQGLEEAVVFAKEKKLQTLIHDTNPIEIKQLNKKSSLTQDN